MTGSPPPLQVRGAIRSFGPTRAVDGVDLELHAGELLVLVGPSGCGKSTLLRAIAGLVALDEGSISVGGDTVDDGRTSTPPEHRPVGMVFQDHSLFPHLTIGDNVAFGIRKEPTAARRAKVAELLAMVEIEHLAKRYPHEVSGGERQRASVARAVAPHPRLLLLDEPFAALDPNLREQVRTQLVNLLRTTRTPAVFVSHDQAEAMALGDRVAVMRAGRLEQLGSGPEIYDRPANRFVASFMGDASFLPVTSEDGELRTELGPVDAPLGTEAGALEAVIRPADVDLVVDPDGPSEIVDSVYQGPTWTYDVRLPSGAIVRSTRPRALAVEHGTRVRASLDTKAPALVETDGG
ncbi:ABC transporter ATP-binding protein [Aquihabitans daechungensis]|uniref:ABC transporter ATP-binding protein n=1 Tax=Aquihabitans daechungensis TaxID=1052257 RepID=UPI003B9FE7DB